MAAAVRNNVWVAPGQDAQLLRKSAAPLTADGLRGEDHGQVLCNTRDAIPGTSSFQDYNLVSDRYFFFFSSLLLPPSITACTDTCRFDVGSVDVADQSETACVIFFYFYFYFLILFFFFIGRCEPITGRRACVFCLPRRSQLPFPTRDRYRSGAAECDADIDRCLKSQESRGRLWGCEGLHKLPQTWEEEMHNSSSSSSSRAAGLQSHWMFLISDMYFQTA